MFHKIKHVTPLSSYRLSVNFSEGVTKVYDVSKLFDRFPMFIIPEDEFSKVYVDVGGYGVVWNDGLDLACDELWEHGEVVDTPFDGLIAMSDATELWELNESTLRKAISYGKQWVIYIPSMIREYGQPKKNVSK